jgi:hypothetical protein
MTRTRAFVSVVATLALIAGSLIATSAHASKRAEGDEHTKNFKQKALVPISVDKDVHGQGSDLAFKGKLVIAGSYQGTAIYKTSKKKPFIKQISFFNCIGGQGDVTVLGDFVFVSVDAPLHGPTCSLEDTQAASQDQIQSGDFWEGIRVVDISNPKRPEYVTSVYAPCGSHTNTLLPGDSTSYLYIESYPLGGQNPDCNITTHRKIQIMSFPNEDPAKLKLLDETIDITPNIGCHDITTFPEKKLMFGACISQSFVWDISDPTVPVKLAVINNPEISIHHSTAMTWDGKILILGDEFAGAEGGGCNGDPDSTSGAAWFYDVSDPSNPTLLGHHAYPRIPQPTSEDQADRVRCTNHNFNVIPMKDPNKYLLAVSYYMGGISVVDFSDPAAPEELGYYIAKPGGVLPDTWASYWYQGRIYTNDYASQTGVGVYKFKGSGKKKAHFFKASELNPAGEMNPQVQIFAGLTG